MKWSHAVYDGMHYTVCEVGRRQLLSIPRRSAEHARETAAELQLIDYVDDAFSSLPMTPEEVTCTGS
jgi:hypothetical protein